MLVLNRGRGGLTTEARASWGAIEDNEPRSREDTKWKKESSILFFCFTSRLRAFAVQFFCPAFANRDRLHASVVIPLFLPTKANRRTKCSRFRAGSGNPLRRFRLWLPVPGSGRSCRGRGCVGRA